MADPKAMLGAMNSGWLADIVVVNESRDEAIAGDITLYRSIAEACDALEHWWVEQGEGFACTAAGHRLTLDVSDNARVIVAGREPVPRATDVVQMWLLDAANGSLERRKLRADKRRAKLAPFEEKGELPTSVEGLIAYIGLER